MLCSRHVGKSKAIAFRARSHRSQLRSPATGNAQIVAFWRCRFCRLRRGRKPVARMRSYRQAIGAAFGPSASGNEDPSRPTVGGTEQRGKIFRRGARMRAAMRPFGLCRLARRLNDIRKDHSANFRAALPDLPSTGLLDVSWHRGIALSLWVAAFSHAPGRGCKWIAGISSMAHGSAAIRG
jgi:hypothetical protein